MAALAVVGPMQDLPADRYGEFGAAVMRAAAELSTALGHVTPAEARAA